MSQRCLAVRNLAEQAKEQKITNSSSRIRSTASSSRIYRGDSSFADFCSRSLSIVVDDLALKPMLEHYELVKKWSQLITALTPVDIISSLVHEIEKFDGEYKLDSEFYELKAIVYLEENEVDFQTCIYQLETDIFLIDFTVNSPYIFAFMDFIKKLSERLNETSLDD